MKSKSLTLLFCFLLNFNFTKSMQVATKADTRNQELSEQIKERCPICYKKLSKAKSIITLNCKEQINHSFCSECIRNWAKIQLARQETPYCPYCYTEINQDLIPTSEIVLEFIKETGYSVYDFLIEEERWSAILIFAFLMFAGYYAET